MPAVADVSLVRFNSCADALQNLRAAARSSLGPSGFSAGAPGVAQGLNGATVPGASAPGASAAPAVGAAGAASASSYSTTNTATIGVDEPDIVKTDGRRIVTITGNVLRVIDVQTRQITGVLDFPAGSVPGPRYSPAPVFAEPTPAGLLLSGNRALVLFNQSPYIMAGSPIGGGMAGSAGPVTTAPGGFSFGTRLALVDLSTGTPRIISEYTMTGSLVDARQIGSVARVVLQSAPRFYVPQMEVPGAQGGPAPDQAAIAHAGLSQWLPRYTVTTGGRRQTGSVDCASISHPAGVAYSGTSMLTVLTFDLSEASLGDGAPVSIVADGDTVYSDGASLYIASRQWTATPVGGTASAPPPVTGSAVTGFAGSVSAGPASAAAGSAGPASAAAGSAGPASVPSAAAGSVSAGTGSAGSASAAAGSASAGSAGSGSVVPAMAQYTAIYKFGIAGSGRPVYEASGTVPGWLLGSSGLAEYSLSAWNGALRVATTTDGAFVEGFGQAQSAVYELEQTANQLVIVGKVGGLGAGEQIFAVRFAGPVGYVVTFRQTDPLYALDLSDPAQPRVAGQLQLSGYSAYLYPIDATHLIGVGQSVNALGQTTGTQVSLFDVSDPAAPVRLAVYDMPFGNSEAEFDPHAFLYWPSSKLLVLPAQVSGPVPPSPPSPVPQGGMTQGGTTQGGMTQGGMTQGGTTQGGTTQRPSAQGLAPNYWSASEAVVLHVGASSITELGTITTPATPAFPAGGPILRSLIAGNALWTLWDSGLKANDMATLAPLAWVRFD